MLMNNWQINKDRSRRMSDDKTSENKMAHYCRQSEALNTNAHVCRLILLFVLTVAAPLAQTDKLEESWARCGFLRKRRLIIGDMMDQLFIFMYVSLRTIV